MSDETPSPANRPKILTIVLAGGHGSRLGPLTKGRAKPALPFGGMFRLIDTVLSNIAHSGLTDVWIVEQYEPHALNEHVAGGRPWDLDRTHGGVRILPTYEQHDDNDDPDDDLERAEGNADALVKQLRFIEDLGPDIVITTSADHLYRLDFRDVIDTHRRCEAGLTIVSTAPPADDDPTRFAWINVDGDTVTGFDDKPDDPDGDAVCTEVFVFDASTLVAELSSLHAQSDSAGDYGDRLIPNLLAKSTVVHHHLDGYWRDLGTINAYHRGHMELVGERPSLVLDDHDRPILTSSVTNGAARSSARARPQIRSSVPARRSRGRSPTVSSVEASRSRPGRRSTVRSCSTARWWPGTCDSAGRSSTTAPTSRRRPVPPSTTLRSIPTNRS